MGSRVTGKNGTWKTGPGATVTDALAAAPAGLSGNLARCANGMAPFDLRPNIEVTPRATLAGILRDLAVGP